MWNLDIHLHLKRVGFFRAEITLRISQGNGVPALSAVVKEIESP